MSIALDGGFADPPRETAAAFRTIMTAMARPGLIAEVAGAAPPAPLSVAAGVLLLTLADADTPLHLAGPADCEEVRDWLRFHTGAPLAGPAACTLAVGSWEALQPLTSYRAGTPEYPDRSATLIAELGTLEPRGTGLTGPGIKDTVSLSLPDPDALKVNAAQFPLGLDLYFTCGTRLAALPRSTRIG